MEEQRVNEYRQPWESDEHWTLRKEFIKRFWDDFPEDRLLCLAQVYSNVELLGCSYPPSVMRQIRELSKNLNQCKELREKRKERAAVQFVKEKQKAPPPRNSWNNSDSRSQKRPNSESNAQANCDTPSGTPPKKLKTSDSKLSLDSSQSSVHGSNNKDLSITEQSSHLKNSQQKSGAASVNAEQNSSKNTAQESDSAPSANKAGSQVDTLPKSVKDNISSILPFIRKSLAVQNSSSEILNNVGSKFLLKVDYNFKFFSAPTGPAHECSIEIDNVFIAKAKELSKKKARTEAAKLAVDILLSPSVKIENSSPSISNEPNTANKTRVQAEQKCPGGTSNQSSPGASKINTDVKSSGSTFDKALSKNSGLSLSNHNSGVRKNAYQNNNLLSDSRICHDPWSQKVTPNVYQNRGLVCNPWANTTTAEPSPWVNKNTVAEPDPWINKTLLEPNPWTNNTRPIRHQQKRDLGRTNPCPEFLIILDNSDVTKLDSATSMFTQSANFNRVPFQFQYEAVVKDSEVIAQATITLNNQEFCSAEAENKQAAKEAVSKVALGILRKTAHTVKVNDEHEGGFTVTRSQVFNTAEANNSLTDSNIGCKMLKMMGWSGGGIGKEGKQGIEEPVKAVEKHKFGQGLGYTKKGNKEVSFTARTEQIIQDYAKSKSTSDLIFSTEFTKEERKEIHRIAAKYNLKNNSKGGKGDGRHIIISRRYTAQQLLDCLNRAGGRTYKYELIPPTG